MTQRKIKMPRDRNTERWRQRGIGQLRDIDPESQSYRER